MRFESIRVAGLRNLDAVAFSPGTGVNFFWGENGAGKTSLLEGICHLSVARSFRRKGGRTAIARTADGLFCGGRLVDGSAETFIGVERLRGRRAEIRVSGVGKEGVANLAHRVPLLAINQEALHDFARRRGGRIRWLDWLLFHVEPGFLSNWRTFKNLLAQRNRLLKSGGYSKAQDDAWLLMLADYAAVITEFRLQAIDQCQAHWRTVLSELMPGHDISLGYDKGWSGDATPQAYQAALRTRWESDLRNGATGIGPQRADLQLKMAERDPFEEISAGQGKMLALASALTLVQTLITVTGKAPILLLDDLPADLHPNNLASVLSCLSAHPIQSFATGALTQGQLPKTPMTLFHVEQGTIIPT